MEYLNALTSANPNCDRLADLEINPEAPYFPIALLVLFFWGFYIISVDRAIDTN